MFTPILLLCGGESVRFLTDRTTFFLKMKKLFRKTLVLASLPAEAVSQKRIHTYLHFARKCVISFQRYFTRLRQRSIGSSFSFCNYFSIGRS